MKDSQNIEKSILSIHSESGDIFNCLVNITNPNQVMTRLKSEKFNFSYLLAAKKFSLKVIFWDYKHSQLINLNFISNLVFHLLYEVIGVFIISNKFFNKKFEI